MAPQSRSICSPDSTPSFRYWASHSAARRASKPGGERDPVRVDRMVREDRGEHGVESLDVGAEAASDHVPGRAQRLRREPDHAGVVRSQPVDVACSAASRSPWRARARPALRTHVERDRAARGRARNAARRIWCPRERDPCLEVEFMRLDEREQPVSRTRTVPTNASPARVEAAASVGNGRGARRRAVTFLHRLRAGGAIPPTIPPRSRIERRPVHTRIDAARMADAS